MHLNQFQWVLIGPYIIPISSLSILIGSNASLWVLNGHYASLWVFLRPYGS